ncbi:1,2-phenylacetyl-CoA epoxidase subunit PaaC [Ferruginibacter sp. HRS2-29]|uniref:1,2-phenylacetyl-CoA epoxidase subunit PaaC n=1 Tax=Ferruginibacter sp. HRS2-29 TaxID=2487334 RepID=UPI0020CC45B9|nr:1,2-phenylacetyl-CoA epoxidase subunit PaaC [Ferruginibacter sp. HRS2-29]MCP9753044.1 phenylacetate-CoA oxygenase subunit PaaI [Ferruginibacter sp. HRS2-29]
MDQQQLIDYTLFLADTNLILAQRNAEWCAHGPILEQDIAITNISLDLIGQSRNFYQHAAILLGNGTTEDSLAYLRAEREFKNLLITELPNNDWAHTVLRQFVYSVYAQLLYTQLMGGNDKQIAAIAEKALKEISYHIKWSSEWVIRLGDGTEESNQRINKAIDNLWPYTGEFFNPAYYETAVKQLDFAGLQDSWTQKVTSVLEEATLSFPQNVFMHSGGKQGVHTENLGYILADLQYLQRAYPGAEW